MLINTFNSMDKSKARDLLRRSCASRRWVDAVVNSRPFKNFEDLQDSAEAHWRNMKEYDLLEAFSAHPQIGDAATLRDQLNTAALASAEQSSVKHADESTLESLAQGNQAYLEKFGFVFVVYATDKSAAEMLDLLQARLLNTKEQELQNAATEQHKITALRMQHIFKPSNTPSEQSMSQITTHVLDTSLGTPAANVKITLSQHLAGTWQVIGQGKTNEDGRLPGLIKSGDPLASGTYLMKFDVSNYFLGRSQPAFYPWVDVVFSLDGSGSHHHIPLLISPYGYSTYRGS